MKKNKTQLFLLIIFILACLLFGLVLIFQFKSLRNLGSIFYKKEPPKIVYKAEETVKILEGWTNQDIADYFSNRGKWTSSEVFEVIDSASSTKSFSLQFNFLDQKKPLPSLEGYLFPDTYRIYASSTVEELVIKMLDNFSHKLTSKMLADIKAQDKTLSQIIIMASILEKEAPFYEKNNNDAKIVSGIFWNRLNNGQALQSDATLSYIFRDNKSSHSGEELNNPSLYNTYKYRGLPPGPICNPGLLAIEAAIYPIKTDYNYFLTAQDGSIYYAKNYNDHLQNKYKYLK
ncbi:MAG: endolytic transglycosylase MltG [Patescibacteria group bacterium]